MKIEKSKEEIEPGFDDITEYDYPEDYLNFPHEEFAKDLYDILNPLIPDDALNEEFMSHQSMEQHFDEHCIGRHKNRKSKKSNVYYDFRDKMQYKQYEQKITNKIMKDENFISSLEENDIFVKYIRKLFEGNYSIIFTSTCGFKNNVGPVSVCLYAFSSDVTKNYKGGNTIDIFIKPGNKYIKTITLYPVDANYLETKFNNLIAKYTDYDIEFKFNK